MNIYLAHYFKILKFLLLIFIITIFSIASINKSFAGGDLGGGGRLVDIKKDFKLDDDKLQSLKQKQNLETAMTAWVNSLTEKEYQDLMIKIFKHTIAPQINQLN